MMRILYLDMDDFKTFYNLMSQCPVNLRDAFFMQNYDLKNPYGPHRWMDHRWLGESRVWYERCILCGAIRIYRGNDTIYIDPDGGVIHILRHKESWDTPFIKKVLKEADSSGLLPLGQAIWLMRNLGVFRVWQSKEEWDAYVKKILKEMKTNG